MVTRYELFDHTADMGVRAFAPTLAELVAPSTEGLYAAMGELTTTGQAVACSFDLAGTDSSLLLRDYLGEVLYLFEHRHRRLTEICVRKFTDRRLTVVGQAHAIDLAQSKLDREVKAITYHELTIRPVPDGFEATYIVDV